MTRTVGDLQNKKAKNRSRQNRDDCTLASAPGGEKELTSVGRLIAPVTNLICKKIALLFDVSSLTIITYTLARQFHFGLKRLNILSISGVNKGYPVGKKGENKQLLLSNK